jgi:hypothetical protein
VISEAVLTFLSGGKSIVVGTRDAQLVPECTRAVGLRVAADRRHVQLLLPEATAARCQQNLRDNGRIAITVGNPLDHRTLQLKGQLTALGPASEEDALFVREYVAQLAQVLEVIGIPEHLIARVNCLPCARAEVRVDEIYLQTPGPGAGSALAGRAP